MQGLDTRKVFEEVADAPGPFLWVVDEDQHSGLPGVKLGGLSKVGKAGVPLLVAEGLRHLGRQARLADAAGAGDEAGEDG